MKIKYYTDDGKNFETKEQCLEYEKELNELEEYKKKLAAERETHCEEVIMAYNNYINLLNKYLNGYTEVDKNVNPWLKFFFE